MSWWGSAVDDELEKQQKEKQQKRASNPDDEDAEIDIRKEKEIPLPINRQRSIFDMAAGKGGEGINNAPSIFEKTAIFHTDQ
ncbi:MAG: hypothetical protein ACOX66_07200 [Oscillospiraceae bacterium]|jgi:hypothetical protein